jgi:hypothetical protein
MLNVSVSLFVVAYRAVAGIVGMIGLTPAQVANRLTLVYLGEGL